MSSSLYRLGLACAHAPWRVILGWIAVIALLGGLAVGLGEKLDDEFSIPGTESQNGLDAVAHRFPEMSGTSGTFAFVTTDGSDITEHRAEIQRIMKAAGAVPDVAIAADPCNEQTPGMISPDGSTVLANIQMNGAIGVFDPAAIDQLTALAEQSSTPTLKVYPGGQMLQDGAVPVSITEAIGVLVALVILAIMFRSIIASFIPILTALVGVGSAMMVMFAATGLIKVSSTAPTLAVMIGLAVGIDYALFIVSRHIDQLRDGMDVDESIARATATSGSAVIFAGMTVVIALVGLFITAIPFLTVMGVISAVAVAANVLLALTLLPALLALLGERLRRTSERRGDRSPAPDSNRIRVPLRERWVAAATKLPALTIILVLAVIAALALPAKDLRLALPDQGTQPEGTAARVSYDLITEKYGEGYNAPILLTADIVNTTDPLGVMDALEAKARSFADVQDVQISTPNRGADMGVVVLIPKEGQAAPSTTALVKELRKSAPAWEQELRISDITVTGSTAVAIDITARLASALLPFGLFVVGLSLVLLAMVFRSVWVPIKAAVGFLFSVAAAFGITAMVFEYGWAASLLNVQVTGPVISFMPIIVMGVLFGLAMDYEVFLVSRMREEFVHTADAHGSIRRGFVASAPVVVAAALIMIVIFGAFVPESTFMIQPIALALAVGVFVDAFIVRMTLVPAVLALLGDRAWRFPAWLDRLLPHMDVEGEGLSTVLEHQRWTAEHGPAVLRLQSAVAPLRSGCGELGPFTGHLEAGRILAVQGEDPAAVDAFLHLTAGRILPSEGHVIIADRILPDEVGAAQRHVLLAAHDPLRQLLEHRPRDPRRTLIVIPSLRSLLTDPDRAVDALERRAAQGCAVVVGCDAPLQRLLDALTDQSILTIISVDHHGPGSAPDADATADAREEHLV